MSVAPKDQPPKKIPGISRRRELRPLPGLIVLSICGNAARLIDGKRNTERWIVKKFHPLLGICFLREALEVAVEGFGDGEKGGVIKIDLH